MNWFWKKKDAPVVVDAEPELVGGGVFSTHRDNNHLKKRASALKTALANHLAGLAEMQPKLELAGAAMDAEDSDNPGLLKSGTMLTQWGISDELFAWYASQAFIGHQACAILAQNWLIDKACTVPARDAVRNWLEITSADGKNLDAEQLKEIERLDKKYRIKKHCHDLVRFGRVFGIRVAMFKVDFGGDPLKEREYYRNPFNIDSVKPGAYKGIVQVDPYWCNPVLDSQDGVQPDSLHFYEPTWWTINGKEVHRSHLVIFINSEVPDMLKPAYMYGGVSVPQKIAERVYASERCANELPLLATSKRQTVLKTDIERAMSNFDSFVEAIQQWITYRDNYQVKVCDKDAEDVVQLDTSLTDLDEVVMTSYQIVAAAANIPATKLLGTTPKGFNATGEYEEASYHEELESIQEHDLSELVNRHHALMCKSEGLDLHLSIEWCPLDSPTAEELAIIRKTDAETDAALVNTGAIDAYDVRTRLIQDNQSGYTWLEAIERPDEPDLEPEIEPDDESEQKSGMDKGVFREEDHPRDDDGKFGSGTGASGKKADPKKQVIKADLHPSVQSFAKKTKSKTIATGRPPGTILEIPAGVRDTQYYDLDDTVSEFYSSWKGTEKEKAANYIRRSIEIGSEEKKYSVSVQFDEKGGIIGSVSMHLIADSMRVETIGGIGGGAGTQCMLSAIRASKKAGKGGAVTLTPVADAVAWYDALGFEPKTTSKYGEFFLSQEKAELLLKKHGAKK